MRFFSRHIRPRLQVFSSQISIGPVLTLVSGAIAAQMLTYLARPILTRLFTPEAFGLFGFFLAIIAVIGTSATGKYEDAIPIPDRDEDAAAAGMLALALGAAVAVVSLLVIPFRADLAASFGRPEVAPLLILIPAGVAVASWSRTTELWLTRAHRFRPIASARAVQAGAAVPIQVGAGLLGTAAMGLAGGYLAGRIAGLATMIKSAVRDQRFKQIREQISTGSLKRIARRYRRFPAFAMPSGLLNNLSIQLPAFLLLIIFAPEFAGLYAIAFATLAVPMQLIGSSVAQVFFAQASEARRVGTLPELTAGIYRRLSAFGLFPMAAIAVAGPAAFTFVFGAEWREAGVYAQFLAPWMFFVFVSAPLSNLFDILEKQHKELAFNVALTISRVVALLVGAAVGDARLAVALFALVSAAFWMAHTLWMLRWGGAALNRSVRATMRHALLATVPLALLGAGMTRGWSDGAIVLLMVLTGLLALALVWRFEPEIRTPRHG